LKKILLWVVLSNLVEEWGLLGEIGAGNERLGNQCQHLGFGPHENIMESKPSDKFGWDVHVDNTPVIELPSRFDAL
jgi:hypothetical protein